jgi:phenylacetate-CoA oxygenase PaaI subunit
MTSAAETPPPAGHAAGAFGTATDQDALERAARAAAPVTADVEAIGAMAPGVRAALYRLLSSLADNKYVLGRRYAEWCTGAPLLESAVAAAAMAQDELGHARSFYPLLRGFPEAAEANTVEGRGWQDRPTRAITLLDRPFRTWGELIAASAVADTAFSVLLGAATETAYEPLRQRARKILQEEEAHWIHARGWLRRLATDELHVTNLAGALGRAWESAATWLGRSDDPVMATLAASGILSAGPDQLRSTLRARLAPTLESGGPALLGVLDRPLPWDRWSESERRLASQ